LSKEEYVPKMSCENISSRKYKYQYNLDNSDIKWRDMFISHRMHMLHMRYVYQRFTREGTRKHVSRASVRHRHVLRISRLHFFSTPSISRLTHNKRLQNWKFSITLFL